MRERHLEITFRKGRALAAYLYLGRRTEAHAARTVKWSPGLVVDYAADGHAMGVEIAAPNQITEAELNRLLTEVGEPSMEVGELAPLRAARCPTS